MVHAVLGSKIPHDRLVVVPLVTQRYLAAIPGAAPNGGSEIAVLTARACSPAQLRNRAIHIAFQDDVDHARDGVGAVGRRRAVDQNVDVIHRERRDDRGIDHALAVALGGEADPIHHQERAGRGTCVEAANIDLCASFDGRARIGRHARRHDVGGGEGPEEVGRVQGADIGEVLRAQIGDRHTHCRGAADERTRDQHGFRDFFRLGDDFPCMRIACIGHGEEGCRPEQRRQLGPRVQTF